MQQNHHSNANQYYLNTTTLELITTTQYYIPNNQSMLPNAAQYYTVTPPMLHQCNKHIGNAISMLLNTTSLNLNATISLQNIQMLLNTKFHVCTSMLPNATNATKVQCYKDFNTAQCYKYYQCYWGLLGDVHCSILHTRS